MMWLKKVIQKFKKNNKEMLSEDQLISYKQNFTGQKFQWIRTPRPELLGKVVTCRDVQPAGNSAIATFDDGSSIDVKRLNNDLLIIMGDQQPLTRDEVTSIYSQKIDPIVSSEYISRNRVRGENSSKPEPAKPRDIGSHGSTANPFLMFNSEESEFIIKINIKLPDKKLLKMMYNSAEDKEAFINQLSDYVALSIDNKVISESLQKMLDASPAKPSTGPSKNKGEIKLTEVRDEQY